MKNNFNNFYRRVIHRVSRPIGNNLTIFSDDTFLVSYPRSGNTWVRFLLGNYLYGSNFDFLTRENFIPAIGGNTNRHLIKVPRPRILKSHSQFFNKYPKVIYLIRDPRDVMISLFHWLVKNPNKRKNLNESEFDKFSKYFFEGDFKFGRWDQHVSGWINQYEQIPNGILFVQYEELKSDTFSTLKKILSFLDRDIQEALVFKAIENASFSKMRNLEKRQQLISKEILPITGKLGFVGEGNQEWDKYITSHIKDQFKLLFNDLMIQLNYVSNNQW